jgi:hypothetical protein
MADPDGSSQHGTCQPRDREAHLPQQHPHNILTRARREKRLLLRYIARCSLSSSAPTTSLYFNIITRVDPTRLECSARKGIHQATAASDTFVRVGRTCGALIVINKALKFRPELLNFSLASAPVVEFTAFTEIDVKMSKFDDESDGEEVYKDVPTEENVHEKKVTKENDHEATTSCRRHRRLNQKPKPRMIPSRTGGLLGKYRS